MRLSAEAMNRALADLRGLQYKTQVASAYDVFLTMKWVNAHPDDGESSWQLVPIAVQQLFGLFPDHKLGRLRAFRYDWLILEDSGRKTVWNNNTRGEKLSTSLLVDNNIRNGLLPNAAALLGPALPPQRPSWQTLAVLVLRDHEFDQGDDWATARGQLLEQLGMTDDELGDVTSSSSLGVPLLGSAEWDQESIPDSLRPPDAVAIGVPSTSDSDTGANFSQAAAPISVSVDARVERMLRLAIQTSASILLVGPPGTGKGTLLKWVLRDIELRPGRYGFDEGFAPDPLWRTPDESWSSFDLIGGLAPDVGGQLKWSSGALLNALRDDRWLILDETNRGDMDKIMGPLLTWMSDQETEIGRSEAHDGKPLHIGWNSDRASIVEETPTSARYLAGTDFRLLGTYNPQDAQRVFRFGQALSRRFVVIPVPAIRPGQFTQLLEDSFPGLASDAVAAISGLYSAHLADETTALGPAAFLRMARYLLAGHALAPDSATAPADGLTEPEADGEAPAELTPNLLELLAEAYVMGIGRYLAGYDDRVFAALKERVVSDESALGAGEWDWASAQRNILS